MRYETTWYEITHNWEANRKSINYFLRKDFRFSAYLLYYLESGITHPQLGISTNHYHWLFPSIHSAVCTPIFAITYI